MRILLISSVSPTPSGGGQMLLHRHLVGQPGIELALVLAESWSGPEPSLVSRPGRFWQRLRATRFTEHVQRLQEELNLSFALGPMTTFAHSFRPDIVLTVAHGPLALAAHKIAGRLGVPLATIFHDWWPDLAPRRIVRNEDNDFRLLYRASRAAFCVCENLRGELGDHPNAPVLLPIPSAVAPPSASSPPSAQFSVAYAGSLNDVYRPGMDELCHRLKNHPRIRLQLWGDAVEWPDAWLAELRAADIYRGDARGTDPEFNDSLAQAGALLTHLSFAPGHARRVRTSFPSKLTDYARRSKPLVVWGPAYSSACKWLRPRDAAELVESPEPAALVTTLERLAADPSRCQLLGERSRSLAESEFAPARLQQIFLDGLRRCL